MSPALIYDVYFVSIDEIVITPHLIVSLLKNQGLFNFLERMALRRGAAVTLGLSRPAMSLSTHTNTATAATMSAMMFSGGMVSTSSCASPTRGGAFRATSVMLKQQEGEATVPSPQGGGKTPAQAAAPEKKQQANPVVDRREWRKFTATPWMMRNVISRGAASTTGEEEAPVSVMFLGEKLGPKPMLLLDGVASSFDEATALLEPYVPLMSALNHKDGVISIPLIYAEGSVGDRDVLSAYCDSIVRALDALGISWPSVVIGRSVGCLVAAKMALLYPERVGGLVSLDTPLVSKVWNKHYESRSELLQLLASADTNVPLATIEAHIEDIIADKEPAQAVQTPNHFRSSGSAKLQELQVLSQKFYETKIFNDAAVFPTKTSLPAPAPGNAASKASFFLSDPAVKLVRETPGALRVDGRVNVSHGSPLAQVLFGTTDNEEAAAGLSSFSGSAYVSPADIASIAHPMLFVTVSGPSAGTPDADMLTHRALLNMRKPTVLKAVKGDVTIMEAIYPTATAASSSTVEVTAAATELANQLRLFGQRFDLFSGLVRRFEQSASDLLKNMEGVKVVAGAGVGEKAASSKKKKGGEKKKP